MSFLDYLDNKQDFLTTTDLLDLIDLNLLLKEEKEKINPFKQKKECIELSKTPIYDFSCNKNNILDNAILFKKNHYSSSDKYFLIDRISKAIIIYNYCLYDFHLLEYTLFNCEKKILDFKKNRLEDYKIYFYEDILKECINFINNKENELIYENYSLLYEHGKNEVDLEKIDLNIIKKLKVSYIYDEKIEEKSFDYISKSDSIFYYMKDKYDFFIINYLRDKNYISELIENEFNKALESIDTHKYTNQKFYEFERTKELKNQLEESFNNDKKLNMYKTIYKASLLAGKTININDRKYENYVYKPDFIDRFQIGRYGDCINFEDIKKITFGRKLLFDIANY